MSTDWILDIDTIVKLLYGHQDGAEISYNPLKPGRPSHAIHTYWIANMRLVRGDSAFGNDLVMGELEAMAQPYLFKLRQSPGVRRLIERQWQNDDWQDVGEGHHAVDARLTLSGWAADRRVVVVRRAVKPSLAVKKAERQIKGQQSLLFADATPGKLWEYAVLVTNSDYPLAAIGQLYRDRADCENKSHP